MEGVVSAALLMKGMDTAISMALPARTQAETTHSEGMGTGLKTTTEPSGNLESRGRINILFIADHMTYSQSHALKMVTLIELEITYCTRSVQ